MTRYQPAHWVSGDWVIDEWVDSCLLTEGELMILIDSTEYVDYHVYLLTQLSTVSYVDGAIERMMDM